MITPYPIRQLHEGFAVLLVVLPVLLLVVSGAVEDVLATGAEGLGQPAADDAVALRYPLLFACLRSLCNRVARLFLGTIYQNGENIPKLPQNYQMTIKYTE
jgi:hypothetical protein